MPDENKLADKLLYLRESLKFGSLLSALRRCSLPGLVKISFDCEHAGCGKKISGL